MDPVIDLPKILLNVLGSVQEENFLHGWRLYAENGHTNIVLKFLPKGQPLPHCQGAKNSTELKHKSPAKIVRGQERAKDFNQSKMELLNKNYQLDTDLDTSIKASDASSNSLIGSNSPTLSTSHIDQLNNVSEIQQTSQVTVCDVKDENKDKEGQNSSRDSGFSQTKVLTYREYTRKCLADIVATPDGPECSSEPCFSDQSEYIQLDYLRRRNYFHTRNHSRSALRAMLQDSQDYGISDPCVHLKMAKDFFHGNYNFSVF